MFFRIEPQIFEAAPGLYTGIVAAWNVDNETPQPAVRQLLQTEVERVAAQPAGETLFAPYHIALTALGVNPHRYPCSICAMEKRIASQHSFPSISPVVDLGNYISLRFHIPVGVHDIDTLNGDLVVRLATQADCTAPENALPADPPRPGEPVYATGSSIRTRRFLWRQTSAGRVTAASRNFLFPIDGFFENREAVNAAVSELCRCLTELFHVTPTHGVLTSENTEFRFGSLTEEEQEVEDQIAMMLKGTAQHTEISEIRRKFWQARKENRPLRVKLGLDPSAPDIHLGHSVVLRKIRQLQDMGHEAVIIIGDFTGRIGDPTGKSKTRKALTEAQVQENAKTYMEQIFKIIDPNKTKVCFNSEWLSKLNFGDVITLASKVTVARMLERDDFQNRYQNHLPLSLHEFFYPLMQAYDSVVTHTDIELGGTDQTFNILMGRSIQRDYGQEPQLTLLMPLLEGLDGVEKMSKSLGNYIGVSESAPVIYEKAMKIPDALILRYFTLCTDFSPAEIKRIEDRLKAGANPRDVKMQLAHELTRLYAGAQAADEAQARFKAVFQQSQVPDDAPQIDLSLAGAAPLPLQLIDALLAAGTYRSKSEIRRLFAQGAALLDNEKLISPDEMPQKAGAYVLRLGKSKFFKLVIQ